MQEMFHFRKFQRASGDVLCVVSWCWSNNSIGIEKIVQIISVNDVLINSFKSLKTYASYNSLWFDVVVDFVCEYF